MPPRKPNYDFEGHERQRLKDIKKAKRAAEKKEARERKAGQPDDTTENDGTAPQSPESTDSE